MSLFNEAGGAPERGYAESDVTSSDEAGRGAAGLLGEDHAQIDRLLRELVAALDKGDVADAFAKLDLLWARLAVHIRAEHLCLFPRLLDSLSVGRGRNNAESLPVAKARRVIEGLREDHDYFMRELANAVNRLREARASGGECEPAALADVRRIIVELGRRLAEHNRLEEERVYRWPESSLDREERSALAAGVRREIENLPPRFGPRRPDFD